MKCAKCGQDVPEGAVSCPGCGGGPDTGDRDAFRGGLAGGLKGFFLGLLPAIWLIVQFGEERGIKLAAFLLPIVTFTTGFVIGRVKAKRESK